jgi:hypothetical protein
MKGTTMEINGVGLTKILKMIWNSTLKINVSLEVPAEDELENSGSGEEAKEAEASTDTRAQS